ncbi:hypothetical protein FisN_28Hh010 [Fistulifera solaris]|uniref:STI1 domain-containing protein n=1 Tax=Fistulifera solaris TaxID=1519565 RepID=A0A1Z5KHJ3_FISSO|nr:hypothetical protein FisN_28Hh010 [Fistulifera solaris]|eukprot:GAX25542.1 hypothetical protein FisN_28Hh010 [Fistulifera solaris]
MRLAWTASVAFVVYCQEGGGVVDSFSIPSQSSSRKIGTRLSAQEPPKIEVIVNDNSDDDDNDDDDDLIAPGIMRVSEIKAELDLRKISYTDCFDKESLVERLQEARVKGLADPSILEKFNRQKLEADFDPSKKVEIQPDDIEAALANDGTIPGGLTPDMFQKLIANPELMAMLQSTKMQEAMTLMMTGGRDELEKKLKEDPELQETVKKLDSIMRSL